MKLNRQTHISQLKKMIKSEGNNMNKAKDMSFIDQGKEET
jgi:hypothetical protein